MLGRGLGPRLGKGAQDGDDVAGVGALGVAQGGGAVDACVAEVGAKSDEQLGVLKGAMADGDLQRGKSRRLRLGGRGLRQTGREQRL